MPRIRVQYDESGPLVEFKVGVSLPLRTALLKAGKPVPPPLPLLFLLDTGASRTMLSDQHMRSLGIEHKGFTQIVTSTSEGGGVICPSYDVSLVLDVKQSGDQPFRVEAIEVVGRPLFNMSIDGMIGRDVINRLRCLTIDGPHRAVTLEY